MIVASDKHNIPIEIGDTVRTRSRGEVQEGVVEMITLTEEEAYLRHVRLPPKVSKQFPLLISRNNSVSSTNGEWFG